MTAQKLTVLITVLTLSTQAALYLLTGGFTLGNRVSDISSEIKLLRAEITSQNQIQDYSDRET
ncbi:hypothetical protein [Nodularia sp. UHCC 0506]|uniref:hypothetical protein n=1 Tax=Nodularia sp. UHCC 0506 TaxID=3110243 RepID=UPI002B21B0FF|nr:hypothetical protein [Nodularia sp. UHCC 0506]MEA5515534.1 hypothetical protein [Nodularia sp. UHCC 0506]